MGVTVSGRGVGEAAGDGCDRRRLERGLFEDDVGATLDKKLEAMACYTTEVRPHPHPRSLESLRTRAAYWGQHAGLAYAEPFVLVRELA